MWDLPLVGATHRKTDIDILNYRKNQLRADILDLRLSSGIYCLSHAFLWFLSTLKVEAAYYSETPVDFYRASRRYIPEDSIIQTRAIWILEFLEYETELTSKRPWNKISHKPFMQQDEVAWGMKNPASHWFSYLESLKLASSIHPHLDSKISIVASTWLLLRCLLLYGYGVPVQTKFD
jgi:hypothetical protein